MKEFFKPNKFKLIFLGISVPLSLISLTGSLSVLSLPWLLTLLPLSAFFGLFLNLFDRGYTPSIIVWLMSIPYSYFVACILFKMRDVRRITFWLIIGAYAVISIISLWIMVFFRSPIM